MRILWLIGALCLTPLAATAQQSSCYVTVDGLFIEIAGPFAQLGEAPMLERLTIWPVRTWNDALGRPVTCDSATTITFLAGLEGFDDAEAARHCLAPLPDDDGYLLVPGIRNFQGLCTRTACERINLAAADVAAVAAIAIDVTRQDPGEITGTVRGSGALLLSGTSLALEQLLGGVTGELAVALATPAGAATLLTAGGLLYYCGD